MTTSFQRAHRISGGDALRGKPTKKSSGIDRNTEDSLSKELNMFSISKPRGYLGSAMILAFLLANVTPSRAQPTDSSAADTSTPTLQDLDQKIRILQRQLELRDADDQDKAATTPTLSTGPDGFILRSADGNYSFRTGVLLQADYRGFIGDTNYNDVKKYSADSSYTDPNGYLKHFPKLESAFLLRRLRPTWNATLWRYYNFVLTPDFAGGTLAVLDAYGEVNYWSALRLRVGKFVPLVGLERLQSSADNNFVEYNFPILLTVQRDIGAQISGNFWNQSISYAAGVFNGAADGANKDIDSTADKTLAGRIFLKPFANTGLDFLSGLGLGIAGSWGSVWGDSVNSELAAYKTSGQNTFFSYRHNAVDAGSVRAAGNHYRVNPEAYWYAGPFSLFGEYVLSAQKVSTSKPVHDTVAADKDYIEDNAATLANQAWGVSASWVVTGEATSFKSVTPRHNLSPDGSGLGAIELVVRTGQFIADPKTFPIYADTLASARKATSFGGGVNWYASRNVKWVFDYEYTQFEQGAKNWAGAVKDRDAEQVATARVQLNF